MSRLHEWPTNLEEALALHAQAPHLVRPSPGAWPKLEALIARPRKLPLRFRRDLAQMFRDHPAAWGSLIEDLIRASRGRGQ